jgi:poly(3-hydroxybutyrate) depolymerase
MFTLLLILALQAGNAPDAKVKEEYQTLLKQLDLENHPERHAQAASWCLSKKWKSQADLHDLESRRYQYRRESDKLKADPAAADLKRLADLAVKMKLEVETAEARGAWIDAELRDRRAKLKPDDVPGLKAIVAWAAKEEAGARAAPLARELLKLEPANEQANLLLGHVKNGAAWISPWDLLVEKGGVKDAAARAAVHKQLEALRPKKTKITPPNPFATCEKVLKGNFPPAWKDRIRAGDGRGTQYLFAPHNYAPAKSYPLILALHGGGNGGVALADDQAHIYVNEFNGFYENAEFVVVAPLARNHVGDSWKFRENALDAVDAVIDACERFNIDRHRIYLMGASMGGQGTQVISWTIPELFPAFCPMAGYYLNDLPCPDLTGKQYLVFHGGKDTVVGQKTHPIFLDKIRAAKATVEFVFMPDEAHFLPHTKVYPRMLEFFKKPALDYEPDLPLVRRMVEELLPWKDKPKEPIRPPAAPAPAAPAGSAVDLLELVDPARDAVAGTWRVEGKTLVSPQSDFARLQVATAVPAEYDLEVVAQRSGGEKADTLVIGLVGGGAQFMVGLDGNTGTKSGLDAIDGKRFVENETTRDGSVFSADKPGTILCSVRKDRVTVSVDGKVVLDWKAEFPRLSLRPAWATRDAKLLFLGSNKCAYRITKWLLRPVGGR